MYKDFFGFNNKPFSIAPDPSCFYMSSVHKEALAYMLNGVVEKKGAVVIMGGVGLGKTTLLNKCLEKLPARICRAVIRAPLRKSRELYEILGDALGVPASRQTKGNFPEYLEKIKAAGGTVLAVDDAHIQKTEILKEVAFLAGQVKDGCLSILLLGQNDLLNRLRDPGLVELKQSVRTKYILKPLTVEEGRQYLEFRLRMAGYDHARKPIFTAAAIDEINKYAAGSPRLINLISDNSLMAAFADQNRKVSAGTVKEVVDDLEGSYAKSRNPAASLSQLRGGREHRRYPVLVWGIPFLTIAILGLAWLYSSGVPSLRTGTKPVEVTIDLNGKRAQLQPLPEAPGPPPVDQADPAAATEQGTAAMLTSDPGNQAEGIWQDVKPGDTVAKFAIEYYGRVSPEILKKIQQHNPGIENLDLIYEGQRVFLPRQDALSTIIYSVSLATYRSLPEAQAVFGDLVSAGLDATIYPYLDDNGRQQFRITMGTFGNRQDAITFSQELKARGYMYAKPVKISMEE